MGHQPANRAALTRHSSPQTGLNQFLTIQKEIKYKRGELTGSPLNYTYLLVQDDSSDRVTGQQVISFFILIDGLVDDILRKQVVAVGIGLEPVSDELLVEGRLAVRTNCLSKEGWPWPGS